MDKLLEVREFDTITGNADYINDEQYKYLNESAFRDLVEFIHEVSGNADSTDALEFMNISYKRNVGDVVTIKNYVGLIETNNRQQIQILPKISLGSGKDLDHEETKRVFLRMLRSMKDFPGIVFNTAGLKIDRMNLYEIFINMYLQEVRNLVKHGIKSDYVNQEDNLNYYKGKLMTAQHLKHNMAHNERFYVFYDEFHPNRPENKLIKATLLKLQHLTTSAENAKEIRQLLTSFEMVTTSVNFAKDFAQVKTDRNTKEYDQLLQWSKVFLMNQSFTTFSGKSVSRALLFPMESIFESYVAQYVRKIFIPYEWEVSIQDKGYYLFEEPKKQFALRPDIVCRRGDRTVILDTKWKRLIDNERSNYGISQLDMYQMYAYSKKYETPEIWLLYPITDEMRYHQDIAFDSGDGANVKVYFVDVAHIEESLESLEQKLELMELGN